MIHASQFALPLLPAVATPAAQALHRRAMAILATVPAGPGRAVMLDQVRAALGPVSAAAACTAWLAAAAGLDHVQDHAAAWLAAVVQVAWPP